MTEDKALLWARERFAAAVRKIGPSHYKMADEVLSGGHDDLLQRDAEAFRAGQAEAEARVKALEVKNARLRAVLLEAQVELEELGAVTVPKRIQAALGDRP